MSPQEVSGELATQDQRKKSDKVYEEVFKIDGESFYRELRLRGYEYAKNYQGVTSSDSDGLRSTVEWKGNWVIFFDSVFQLFFMNQTTRDLCLLTNIRKVKILPGQVPKEIGGEVQVTYNPNVNRITSPVIEVEGIDIIRASRRHLKQGKPALEERLFLPFVDSCALSSQEYSTLREYSQVCTTVVNQAMRKSGRSTSLLTGEEEANQDLVNKYQTANDSKHVLLDALYRMQTSGGSVDLNDCVLAKDLISTACMSERSFRACLDCFLGNVGATKLNILEISNNSVVYPEVDKFLKLTYYGHLVTNYTLAKVGSNPVPSELTPSASVTYLDSADPSVPQGSHLIVAKDIFTTDALPLNKTMIAIANAVRENGFVLLAERTRFTPAEKFAQSLMGSEMKAQDEAVLEKAFRYAELELICKKNDGSTFVVYLLRKISKTATKSQQVFRVIEDTVYTWIEDLKAIMKQDTDSDVQETVWVVDDRPNSGICGLFESLMKEIGGSKFRVYCNASLQMDQKAPKFDLASSEVQEIIKKDLRFNCYRNGQWGTFGSVLLPKELESRPSENCYLNVTERGDLNNLRWIQSESEENGVKVQVVYSGLNDRDILIAGGKIQPTAGKDQSGRKDCGIGLEFSGVETGTGRRVMGLVSSGGVANVLNSQPEITFDVPAQLSLEEAATLPFAYLTAYYALDGKARLESDDTVLVHNATSDVAQASIFLALARECTVLATVDSQDKKRYLLNQHPNLKSEHVMNMKTDDFEDRVMDLTSRNGVDVVVNFVAETTDASVRCLKFNGRFLDMEVEVSSTERNLDSKTLSKNVEFFGINLPSLLVTSKQKKLKAVSEMFKEGLRNREVTPLKRTIFSSDQVTEAFRSLDSESVFGKVLVKIREEPSAPGVKSLPPAALPAQPKLRFAPHKSAVVIGGTGGIGFELVIWLVEKGVDKVIISSRTGLKNDYQRYWMHRWQKEGLKIQLCHDDISTDSGCRSLLTKAGKLGPVGSIFHLAMVLRDGLLENLTPQDYVDVGKVKVIGSRNLDACSRDLCPELEHLVSFSSILCAKGVGGLGNYCYSNCCIERVSELRHKQGLPAMAIELGIIGDTGVYYDEFGEGSTRHYDLRGSIPLNTSTVFLVMERYMLENKPVLSYFARADETETVGSTRKNLLAVMGNILGISDPSTLRNDTTLGSLGMDSLMVVEAKQILDTDYNTNLSVPDVLKLTIQDLKTISAEVDKAE